MAKVRFKSKVALRGINPYVLVQRQVAERLKKDWRRPMPVKFRVRPRNRIAFTNLVPAGAGRFYLYLHEHIRRATGVGIGDAIHITLEFDETYRPGPAHPMPKQLRLALSRDRRARESWMALTPSRQKELLRYLAALKTPAAQERNIHKAIAVLTGAKQRFLAREWNAA